MTEPGTSHASNSPENSEDEFPDTEEEEDDEETLALEELDDDPDETAAELAALEEEQDMSVEQLMARYCGDAQSSGEPVPTLAPLSTSPLPAKRRRGASKPTESTQEPPEKIAKPSSFDDLPTVAENTLAAEIVDEPDVTADISNVVDVKEAVNGIDAEESSDSAEIVRNRSDSLMTHLMNGDYNDNDEEDGDFVLRQRKKEVNVGDAHQVTVDDQPLTAEQRAVDRVNEEFAVPLWKGGNMDENDVITYLATLYTNPACGGSGPLRSAVSAAKLFGENAAVMDARARLMEEAHLHKTLNGRVVQDNECMLYALMKAAHSPSSAETAYMAHFKAVNEQRDANHAQLMTFVQQMPDMDNVHKSYFAYREHLTSEQLTANEEQFSVIPPLEALAPVAISGKCDERFEKNMPAHRPWLDANECDQFENSLVIFSKRWNLMHKFALPHRSVAELVCYYYHWKKSERHDMFLRSHQRLEKKGYILSPHTADQMEPFVEHLTNPTVEGAAQFHHPQLYNPADATTHHYAGSENGSAKLPHLQVDIVDAVLRDTPE